MKQGIALSLRGMVETLAISIPTVLEAAAGKLTMEVCDQRLHGWSRALLAQADVQLDIQGRELLRPGEAYVVMSNHSSLYDVPVLFQSYPGRLRMVAKSELFKVPVWGKAMRVAGFIEVDRKRSEQAIASLKRSKAILDGGVSVWIAPEGTRSRSGELGTFKSGGFMLALDTGHKILPVGLAGTEHILPAKGALVHKGAQVAVRFGSPIDPASFGVARRAELMAEVRLQIQALSRRAQPQATHDSRA
jgi:1-acyl-sn-glycerol-3-phosphate acyltransferase